MNGVGRLTKNELIKTTKQTSWKIITVIILALAILYPVLMHFASSSTSSFGSYYYGLYENAEEGSVEKEYYGVMVDAEEFFVECGITTDNWRYETYFYEYEDQAMTVKILELVKDGRSINDVLNWFYSGSIWYDMDVDGNYIDVTYAEDLGDGYVNEIPLTKEVAEEFYIKEKAVLDTYAEMVKNSNISDYAEQKIANLEALLEEDEIIFEEAKSAYEADESMIYDYQVAAYELNATKTAIDVWNIVKTAEREEEEWLLATGNQVFYFTDRGSMYAITDRETFERDASAVNEYKTYENYVEIKEKGYNDQIAALAILKHSAQTRNPLPDLVSGSERYTVNSAISSNASIVLFFCMILAATIVASEHTSGTIRLLVIRPRARWKILLSKLMCVVIYGVVMFVAASALSVATNLIISGTGDLSLPYLIYRDGAVKEVAPALYILANTLVSSLPSILLVSVAFLLSVIMKKVVFAVALPLLVSMFGALASEISLLLMTRAPFLKWTILPYYSITNFTQDQVTRVSSYQYSEIVNLGLTLETGIILFLIHIVIAIAISFIVFRRQQIKN